MNMTKKNSPAESLFLILSLEKIAQHGLTALMFALPWAGIPKPDIGSTIHLGYAAMARLNLAYTLALILGVYLLANAPLSGKRILVFMALLDIVLEFVFHGLGFITVSVIVSAMLVGLSFFIKNEKRAPASPPA